ncbi:MAG: ATP-binding cassette domain-containing protein [Rhodococcus sp. (in: high G+C Gram-positive bacteria)]|nr:ATP-binding cassette domain-containing protein [Rhodococcus sp. (in: high G+C Gram-positive bacteria)]
MGPNGAGKTTLFNLLTGIRSTRHRHVVDGRPGTGARCIRTRWPARVWCSTFQLTKALSKLDCAGQRSPGCHRATRRAHDLNTVHAVDLEGPGASRSPSAPTSCCGRFKLDAKADDLAGSLSGGQRKLLEMARALMTDPSVVMLDEPMAGVNPGSDAVTSGAHQVTARRRYDGGVRRARHGRHPRHQ